MPSSIGFLKMNSVFIRLAAPLQSWAKERLTGNIVHTEPFPTRTGIEGLMAASLGVFRSEWKREGTLPADLDWIRRAEIAVRVEKRGEIIDEFQTINPRKENDPFARRMHMVLTSKKPVKLPQFTPDARNFTAIVRRTYLSGAEYLVSIAAGEYNRKLFCALRSPVFSLYLGRRAFAPTFPFFLGFGNSRLLYELPTIQGEGNRSYTLNLYQLETNKIPELRETHVMGMSKADWFTQIGQLLLKDRDDLLL
jgi:CRISPR-associated protein Cas5/CasD subtype I-E